MKKIFYFFLICIFYGCSVEDNSENKSAYNDTSVTLCSICSDVDSIAVTIFNQEDFVLQYKLFPLDEEIVHLRPVFRIPQIMVSEKETVLATCENREIRMDKGEIDILLARKEYGSTKWTIQKIYSHNDDIGRSMNPTFYEDRANHRIYLFVGHFRDTTKYSTEHMTDEVDFVYKFSDDDGITWSCEYSLKETWDLKQYTAVIPSTLKGIKVNDRTFVVPSMAIKDEEWYTSLLINENGQWKMSCLSPNMGDCEPTVFLDNDKRLIIDCRTSEPTRRRYLYDLEKDVYIPDFSPTLSCQSAISAEIVRDGSFYYMSYPDSKRNDRDNISLYISQDAYHWSLVYHMMEGYADYGYSGIAISKEQFWTIFETSKGIFVHDLSDKTIR